MAAESREGVIEAREVRRNPWILGAAMLPLAAIPVLLLLAVFVAAPFAMFTLHLGIVGSLLTAMAWRKNPHPRLLEVDVEVRERVLRIGEREIPRAEITRAVVVPNEGELEVRLQRKPGLDFELRCASEEQASGVVEALGLDVSQSVASFRAASRAQASPGRLFLATMGTMLMTSIVAGVGGAITPLAMPAMMFLGMIALFTLLFVPTRVEIGADGVLLVWMGRKRFFAHDAISGVSTLVTGFGRSKRLSVRLGLAAGGHFDIAMGAPAFDGGRAKALAARIEKAGAASVGDAEALALLQRGGVEHGRWVSALRARQVTHHRAPALPKDRLWPVIEDAGAVPSERAAAAVALGVELSDTEKERLRSAARATAAPRLRVVLESAAEADEAELAELLEAIEQEQPVERRR